MILTSGGFGSRIYGGLAMALIDDVKTAKRIRHSELDNQITRLIGTARQEMIRAGVHTDIANDDSNQVIAEAIITYALWKLADTISEMESYEGSWQYQLDCIRKSSFDVSGGDGDV